MNILATALIAFATFGTAATAVTVLEPTCQDLAGQGFACADVVADPNSGVDADVIVVIEPAAAALAALGTALEPTCQDLAGQGSACAEVVADPNSGVDADVVVVLEPGV